MNPRVPALVVALILVGLALGPASDRHNTKVEASQNQPARTADDIAFEETQTAKLLGVPLLKFPAPQGLNGMDGIPATARPFTFTVKSQLASGPQPRVYFEEGKIVEAVAPDGSIYAAYCGSDNDDSAVLTPDDGFVSTFDNRRQWYENHLGYGFMPRNVYIGKREGGRIRPTLFFRDVGSHTTAPHYLAIDNRGMVHLAVADVNISQDNRLDMYWVSGDPRTGKWTSAWLIDRRGFTSWSNPWSGAWNDKVQLLWDWCDVSIHKNAPGMGAYHVEWSQNGFGRKTRFFNGPVRELEGAIDERSGLLVIVVVRDEGGIYVLSRSKDGTWTRPALLHPTLTDTPDVSITASNNGTFVIRTNSDMMREDAARTKEWLLRPTQ